MDGLDNSECGHAGVEVRGAPAVSEAVLIAEAVDVGESLVEDCVLVIIWVRDRKYQPLAKGYDGRYGGEGLCACGWECWVALGRA